jgi:N-acetylmuramic acid 6-phosphate (MurNAc-6-P) etherase
MSAPSTPPEHLEQLPTERRLPASANLDQLSTLEMLRVINDEDAKVAAAVQAVLPQIALERADVWAFSMPVSVRPPLR